MAAMLAKGVQDMPMTKPAQAQERVLVWEDKTNGGPVWARV